MKLEVKVLQFTELQKNSIYILVALSKTLCVLKEPLLKTFFIFCLKLKNGMDDIRSKGRTRRFGLESPASSPLVRLSGEF